MQYAMAYNECPWYVLFSKVSALFQMRTGFCILLFKVKFVEIMSMYIWHIALVCLTSVISDASILLPSSDAEMVQSSVFSYGNSYPPENTMLTTKDFQSRLNILENVVYQLKKENRDQREGIQQLKIQNANQNEEILNLKNEINHQKEGIRQLKTENTNQKEDIRQLKVANKNQKEDAQHFSSVIDSLIIDCAIFNRSKNHHVKSNQEFYRLSIADSTGSIEKPNGIGSRIKRQSNSDGNTSASWAKLEISDHVIGYMDYDTYTVKIYGHNSNKNINIKNDEKKYYFEPISQLDHRSAKSIFNNYSMNAEMTFNVNMWSDSIRNAVHKFIAEDLKLGPVNINLVRVLPMDRVVLLDEVVSSQHFEIEKSWIYYKSDKYLQFKYKCDELGKCEDLAVQMIHNPEQFHLNMKFSLSSQISQTKTTTINIESIVNGEMMNKLQQKLPNNEIILVTATGKKQLVKELSENVIIQTIDDSQIPSQDSLKAIERRLENMIQFSRATIQKDDEKTWDNVFWNQDNYRPDMTARIVNDIYNKSDTENQNKLASAFKDTNKVDVEASLSTVKFSAGVKTNTDLSREGSNSSESLNKFLKEAKDRVEWDGVKFVPKKMELYAVNIARLKNSQEFKDVNVQIAYTTSMLTIGVRHDTSFDQKTSSELFELQNKVSELEHVKRKDRSSHIPPASCQELSERGHYLDGIYAIKNKDAKKVQAVYCQFEPSSVVQELVGNIDVKTKIVHFYVQRNSSFDTRDAVIPFELARINVGNGFNLTSGIFNVPVPGIYHFDFSAVKDASVMRLWIYLQVNGANVGLAFTNQYAMYTIYTGSYDVVSLSASLRLAAGDRVNVYNWSDGKLHDDSNNLTHFTGWLVEEDLM